MSGGGLRINENMQAIVALRNLRLADSAQAKSLRRLSEGLRIRDVDKASLEKPLGYFGDIDNLIRDLNELLDPTPPGILGQPGTPSDALIEKLCNIFVKFLKGKKKKENKPGKR